MTPENRAMLRTLALKRAMRRTLALGAGELLAFSALTFPFILYLCDLNPSLGVPIFYLYGGMMIGMGFAYADKIFLLPRPDDYISVKRKRAEDILARTYPHALSLATAQEIYAFMEAEYWHWEEKWARWEQWAPNSATGGFDLEGLSPWYWENDEEDSRDKSELKALADREVGR